MRFEEILPLMREGEAAKMESDNSGEHWICCMQGNEDLGLPMVLSIARLNKNGHAMTDSNSMSMYNWAIMADDWVVCDRGLQGS